MVTSGQVDVGAVDKAVLLHVHALRVGGLLPLLAHSPAGAGATEPDPLIVLFGKQRGLRSGEAFFFRFGRQYVRVVGGRGS